MASSANPRDSNWRTRSTSPEHKSASRRRSRSPQGRAHDQGHSYRHHKSRTTGARAAEASSSRKPLPFKAQELRKRDLAAYRHMFALYLDVQKQIELAALDESEVKGRWKSFMRKWNDGDLAEGWYDPSTKHKADEQALDYANQETQDHVTRQEVIDDDSDVGPALPKHVASGMRSGPMIPNSQDLRYRDELISANRAAAREDVLYERKTERRVQKEQLDELVPRADAGTRERQLEKKRDAAASQAAYRETRSPGAEDVREGDLMGDDGIDTYKRKMQEEEKKKTERQIRKEEMWRARAEERREKLSEMKAKEDKTIEMLKSLAKQRFG